MLDQGDSFLCVLSGFLPNILLLVLYCETPSEPGSNRISEG